MLFIVDGPAEIKPTSRHAIVTIAIGGYRDLWMRVARPSWLAYAARHGIDIIAITAPMDTSARAAARSPAWQKCLILSQPWSGLYDRIAWVDADIIMNQFSPSIFEQDVPAEMVGATIIGDCLSTPEKHIFLERQHKTRIPHATVETEWRKFQNSLYLSHNINTEIDESVSTGVLVISPKHHTELLLSAYDADDYGQRSYEQPCLSHNILSQSLYFPISPRFNWMFIHRLRIYKSEEVLHNDFLLALIGLEVENSYFLHFALLNNVMETLVIDERIIPA